jgi:hypothetical protein
MEEATNDRTVALDADMTAEAAIVHVDEALRKFRHVTFVSTQDLRTHTELIRGSLPGPVADDSNVAALLASLTAASVRLDAAGSAAETAPAGMTLDTLLDLRLAVAALVSV